jgi:hypothetical protein
VRINVLCLFSADLDSSRLISPFKFSRSCFFFEIHRAVDDDTYRPSHDLRLITIHIILGEEIYVERLHELIH